MSRIKKEVFYKKIRDLTQEEFESLFHISTDINDPDFKKRIEPIANNSIADVDIEKININELDFVAGYLLGGMSALKQEIPKNHLMLLFGEYGCGKSHLTHLIAKLQQMDLKEITGEIREFFGYSPKDYSVDEIIRDYKDMADHIKIIPKKTTRPPRDGEENKPEVQAGVSKEEVQKCDWTYQNAGNIYGVSKEEIDKALETDDAMVIVNNAKVIKDLKKFYGEKCIPILILRAEGKEEWKDMMTKDNRSAEEIEKRSKLYGFSKKIYGEIRLPEVILNLQQQDGRNKTLLIQLRSIKNRHDGSKVPLNIEKEEEK